MASPLSDKQILAGASEALTKAGYSRPQGNDQLLGWPCREVRLYEDDFGVVALLLFDTWSELVNGWPEGQARFIDLIGEQIQRSEPKAWEGYLVLITSENLMPGDERILDEIRYDMNRVRKLVATGDRLDNIKAIEEFLAPLMPVEPALLSGVDSDLLALLPALLEAMGVERGATAEVVKAFDSQEPLIEALHDWIVENS